MRRRSPQSSTQVPGDFVEVLVEGGSFPAVALREPVEDSAPVETHPERHLHAALLLHGLELSDRHRHAVRLDQGPRIADRDEALAVRRELPERLVRPIAERPEVHPEPLPRAWMQSGIIDIPVQETLLLRLRGFRGSSISEGVVRQPVLTAGHELLVRQGVAECVKLAVFRDPHEKMPAFFAHLDESLHHRELLREFRQRAVDRDDAPFEVVCEVDGRLAFDQSAVFVHHVPRLLLPPLFREFKDGPEELILGGVGLLKRPDANHALHDPPVLPPEALAVERVSQESHGNQGEPPARKIEQEGGRPIDGNHLLRRIRAVESTEVRDLFRREWYVPGMLHEELELTAHVFAVALAWTSARDSWFGVIATPIRPGNRSAISARCVIRITFSKTSPIRRSFWTKSSREISVSREPRSPSSMNNVFMRPNVRPICGIEASSRAIAKRRAALICVFSPPLNSATSCHSPSTPWTRIRIPWPRPSSYVSSRIRPKRLSVSSERFFDASISSSGRSWSTAYITTPRLWNTRFTRTS